MKKNNIWLLVGVAVIAVAVGFFGGMEYQKSQRQTFSSMQFNRQTSGGQGSGRSMMQGSRPVTGEIIGKDESSITVKSQDGSSKIVFTSSSTSINKASKGTMDDLKTGEQIAAFGTTNSDGSITAQSIQLNPGEGFRGGFQRNNQQGN